MDKFIDIIGTWSPGLQFAGFIIIGVFALLMIGMGMDFIVKLKHGYPDKE